jgi:hypothetical protein
VEVALRRRLAGVADISISQQAQTAAVTFVPGTLAFSAEDFRSAVAEAEVEVLTLDVRVCGVVDDNHALRTAAPERPPLVQLHGDVRLGASVCVTGRLDDRPEPDTLDVVSAQPRS